MNQGGSDAPDAPVDPALDGPGHDASAVDALQVTPAAERRQIFGLIAAALPTEHHVVRRHVPAAAHRVRAAVAIAQVNSLVGALADERRTPNLEEVLAQVPQEPAAAGAFDLAEQG